MAFDRNDRRYGNPGDRGYGGYGADRGRDYGTTSYGRDEDRARSGSGDRSGGYGRDGGRRDYGGDPRGYDYQDRGFFDRAGDEVRSWFGDEDAERRRQSDERNAERDEQRDYGRGGQDSGRGYGASQSSGRDYGYGAGYFGGGSEGNRSSGNDRTTRSDRQDHDPSYRSWRDRQMESFDRDYDDYRRENQSRFDSEFKTWREGRQGQRDLLTQVQEHFEVVGLDGDHVGTVDHVKGDQIELTKSDKDAGGRHHMIPSSWLKSVEGNKVTLSKTADQAKQHWRDEARDAGGSNDRTQSANRSFSGSYRS